MNKTNKIIFSILGVLALIIITVGASYAFYTYSRTGITETKITSGDISFSFFDKQDVKILNAYPLADSIGANDTNNIYEFTVSGDSSSNKIKYNYNVTILSNNQIEVNENATIEQLEAGTYVKGYFTNDQIKVNLLKNDDEYIIGGSNEGVNLATFDGFPVGVINGSQLVTTQTINAGEEDNYKLRIWIDDTVKYTNTSITDDGTDEYNDQQTSIGKYNGFTYSLKVRINSSASITE